MCRTGPDPVVKSKNPETVPENSEEVVVPVVFTTTTKSDCAGTMKEYDAFGTDVPSPITPRIAKIVQAKVRWIVAVYIRSALDVALRRQEQH